MSLQFSYLCRMPYKDSNNPKLLAYKKAYYLRTKETLRASRRQSVRVHQLRNKDLYLTYNLILLEANEKRKSARLKYFRDYENRQSENLTTLYGKKQLKKDGFTTEQIAAHPELIEVKLIILKTKRLCKQYQISKI